MVVARVEGFTYTRNTQNFTPAHLRRGSTHQSPHRFATMTFIPIPKKALSSSVLEKQTPQNIPEILCLQNLGDLNIRHVLRVLRPVKSELSLIKKISEFTHLQLAKERELPGGVGRRHMVLKCLGVVLQRSAEVVRGFPAEEPLEFWDDGWL